MIVEGEDDNEETVGVIFRRSYLIFGKYRLKQVRFCYANK